MKKPSVEKFKEQETAFTLGGVIEGYIEHICELDPTLDMEALMEEMDSYLVSFLKDTPLFIFMGNED